ncbi:unnamed protein product [Darwinula stevensoni]|uniref:Uncharacterized protein n=1 Tax=Darwinula stevensoni TaxID=69355 RepID=A0A7R9AEU2_9CRUS|nr:unnamed protein product [Darwinula stevensoni]CAG0902414.1 unnamed protein product [Darwinula stevensoni]
MPSRTGDGKRDQRSRVSLRTVHSPLSRHVSAPVSSHSLRPIRGLKRECDGDGTCVSSTGEANVPKHYDPKMSPTFHAVQAMEARQEAREQEAPQQRIYHPPQPLERSHFYPSTKIQQSYSFKKVMADVLGDYPGV